MLERLKYLFFAIILLATIAITVPMAWKKYHEKENIDKLLRNIEKLKPKADKNVSDSFRSIYYNFKFAKTGRREVVRFFRKYQHLNNPEADFYLAKALLSTNDKNVTREAVRILIKLAKSGHRYAKKELCHKEQYTQCKVKDLKAYYDRQIDKTILEDKH